MIDPKEVSKMATQYAAGLQHMLSGQFNKKSFSISSGVMGTKDKKLGILFNFTNLDPSDGPVTPEMVKKAEETLKQWNVPVETKIITTPPPKAF
ncbi:MAG: hypothetical protein H6869_08445 [Rhodospirillales bacterium]|nr:hypothetical protein [Rhodospirillales bacterium]